MSIFNMSNIEAKVSCVGLVYNPLDNPADFPIPSAAAIHNNGMVFYAMSPRTKRESQLNIPEVVGHSFQTWNLLSNISKVGIGKNRSRVSIPSG